VTVRQLTEELERSGFRVNGRASKAISDSLRWAIPRGWISPAGRGAYAPGRIGKSTQSYMRQAIAKACLPGGDPVLVNTMERRIESRVRHALISARVRDLGNVTFELSLGD
jgi:hypothetical protein